MKKGRFLGCIFLAVAVIFIWKINSSASISLETGAGSQPLSKASIDPSPTAPPAGRKEIRESGSTTGLEDQPAKNDLQHLTITALDELGQKVLNFSLTLSFRAGSTLQIPRAQNGEVMVSFPLEQATTQARLIAKASSPDLVPLSFKFPVGLGLDRDCFQIIFPIGYQATIHVGDQLNNTVSSGYLKLRPQDDIQFSAQVDQFSEVKVEPFVHYSSKINLKGEADFSGLLPGSYWISGGRGAWWMKQGKLVTISGLRTHMDFEVEAWDLQNYASGHIFWPDGPDDWQHHIGFAKSGKSQSAFAFGRQDFAQFHLRCEPNNPQRFTVLYQNTKVAIKDLELTNGVHDYSFTIEGTIAEE